ncbi:YggS family pyridoxal phosphate-dependent enzyme [Haloferula chungangensis]|uniref:Pyridoxal phosphate homeostasis protein n=1 Tax=Haloferula chungangensis TaxID=1048331 RepID=A0ABW2LBL1_9BACT
MAAIAERLSDIRERVSLACLMVERKPEDVLLLAVSKTFPASCVQEAFESGQVHFGESRQQEAAEKVAQLPAEICWHFIGKLQRNKVRKVLADFDWLHSVDSLKLAGHIDRIAGEEGKRPKVFLEVNLAGEENKGGFQVDELRREMDALAQLSNLSLQGIMVIPPAVDDPEMSRPWFIQARELQAELREESGLELPHLSMGMSGDFEVAIEEGSTIVRVGSAIFGGR